MRDPFAALRATDAAVQPSAEFTATLRARLERALALPRGVTMTATVATLPAQQPGAVLPYLAVRDARAAIDWYVDVFGARVEDEPIVMPDGRIGHAELRVGDGILYLADEHPEIGVVAPQPGAASVSLMLPVDDADAVRARALARGASGDRAPYDSYGTRNAWIVDPFGHRWGLHSPLHTPASEPVADVAYVSLNVADVERAKRFYGGVFGWPFEGTHANTLRPHVGLYPAAAHPTLFCCFTVPDLDAAVERVRAAGGAATDPTPQAWSRVSDCTDDQGWAFALFEETPSSVDDLVLSYVTLEVRDSARTRDFLGAVLGWTFRPGSIADGWQVEDTLPMAGISGGHEQATTVPVWRVDDIVATVAAVRAYGGTATDPEQQPYGLLSECVDDQGMRFCLGQ